VFEGTLDALYLPYREAAVRAGSLEASAPYSDRCGASHPRPRLMCAAERNDGHQVLFGTVDESNSRALLTVAIPDNWSRHGWYVTNDLDQPNWMVLAFGSVGNIYTDRCQWRGALSIRRWARRSTIWPRP
jgi:hypothetical protein